MLFIASLEEKIITTLNNVYIYIYRRDWQNWRHKNRDISQSSFEKRSQIYEYILYMYTYISIDIV